MNKKYAFNKGYTVYRTKSVSGRVKKAPSYSLGKSISRSVTNKVARSIARWIFGR
jgi:hypothetical protein